MNVHKTQLLTVALAASSMVIASQAGDEPLEHNLDPDQKSNVLISGHRGSARLAPEETLASYQQAMAEKADFVEGDVQLTADDELILFHDNTLARTTNVEDVFPDRAPWTVGDFTLDEIKLLDAGSWHRPEFSDQKVPTLAEVLDLTNGRVGLSLELKSPENSPGVAAILAEELARYDLVDDSRTDSGAYQIHVHSRDEVALNEFADSLPDVPLAVLTGPELLDDETLADRAVWTTGVFADARVTSASYVQKVHSYGLEVYSHPLDGPEQVGMAINQGYDWIVTNQPGTTREVREGQDPRRDGNGVVVDHVFQDAPGDDAQPENGEYVALRNTTAEPIGVGGHYLRDQAGRLLDIGDGYMVEPGSILRVYVGPGTNRQDAYYNGYTNGSLDNKRGDTVTYYDGDHAIVDTYSYIVPQ